MRTEREPRRLERQSGRGDAVMENPQRSMRIERQHHDATLHETHRRPDEFHRAGGRCNRLEFLDEIAGSMSRLESARSRRARDCDMGRLVPRETRIVLFVDLANSPPCFSTDLGDDEDPVQLHYRRTTERTGMSVPLFDTESGSKKFPVEPVVGMRVLVPEHLDARQCADSRAGENIACPVLIVVNARYAGECRRSVQDWADDPPRVGPPVARLRGDERKGERSGCMSGWKGSVVIVSETAKELEVSRVVPADIRTPGPRWS